MQYAEDIHALATRDEILCSVKSDLGKADPEAGRSGNFTGQFSISLSTTRFDTVRNVKTLSIRTTLAVYDAEKAVIGFERQFSR